MSKKRNRQTVTKNKINKWHKDLVIKSYLQKGLL